MRSSVADYEVMEPLEHALGRPPGMLCRPPRRLGIPDESVMVSPLAVDAGGWRELVEVLTRFSSVASEGLLYLVEVGPDLDPEGHGVYLASEATSGGCLVSPSTPAGLSQRVRAVAAGARGAHALHEAGIAHGAISPRSVYLTERGGALGPPPLDAPSGAVADISEWRVLVSVDPDLLAGHEPSRCSDIWSIGATLHTALSGKPLYEGIDRDPPVTALQKVLFTRPSIDPDLPGNLADTIASCLQVDPDSRPRTAAEVADHLLASGAAG